MAASHVIGVNLQLWLGEELAVIIQKQRLADLVAVGFLCALFDEDFALKHADGTVAQHLFEHLPAFAIHRVMGDEDRVVMVKHPVAHSRTGHGGHRVVAGQLDHAFIAGQHAIGSQGEGFERAFSTKPGEDMRRRAPLMVTALGADMVEAGPICDIDLHHLIKPRSRRAVFGEGDIAALLDLDHMMQDRVGTL